jgi:hypothetical protein
VKYAAAVAVVLVLAAAATSPVRAGLLALGLAAAYCVLALVKPHRPCGRCGGTRRSKRHFGVWGKGGKCRKCRGRGRHKRFGATAVHRFKWAVIGERDDQRDASQREASHE